MADAGAVSIFARPERQGRGPRPAYSRARITEAAVRIADADGLEAASMRRIAAELGTGAMSLYRYVPSRDDLIELMYDHAVGTLDVPARPSGDWRADLRLVARNTRAMWLAHPWMADLHRARPALGPNQLRIMEFGFGALDVGIPVDDIMTLMTMLNGYVEMTVRGEIEWERERLRTGMTEKGWMHESRSYVQQLLDRGEHPMFARVVNDAALPHMSAEEQFSYGVERVLDCIASSL